MLIPVIGKRTADVLSVQGLPINLSCLVFVCLQVCWGPNLPQRMLQYRVSEMTFSVYSE